MDSPIAKAKEIYEAKRAKTRESIRRSALISRRIRGGVGECGAELPEPESFDDALARYRRTGVVRSTSKCFVMAKETFLPRLGPAWFCTCGVGDMQDMIAGMPYSLGYIAFPRRGQTEARVYRADRFLQLIRSIKRSANSKRQQSTQRTASNRMNDF